MNSLEVFDEGGEIIASGHVDNYYISGQEDGGLATNKKTLCVPVPGLRPGCVLKYVVTWEDRAAAHQFPFERKTFYTFGSSKYTGMFVTGDVEHLAATDTLGEFIKHRDEQVAYWVLPSPPRFHLEKDQPSPSTYFPNIVLGSADDKWDMIGAQYLQDIAHRLPVADSVKSLAADITRNVESYDEKALAILRWVRGELQYQGIEFGVRGRMPNTGETIIQHRYGDCKDHSLLAWQLLKAVEIPAHLVLIRSHGAIAHGQPSLNQFDHMILYVSGLSDGTFVDCTSKYSEPRQARAPQGLSGQDGLILDPENIRFETLPSSVAEVGLVKVVRKVTLSADQDAWLVKEAISFAGSQASWMRAYLDRLNAADRVARLQEALGSDNLIVIEQVKVIDQEDVSVPLKLVMQYRLAEVKTYDSGWKGKLPILWERMFLKPELSVVRRSPFEQKFPFRIRTSTMLSVEEGQQVQADDVVRISIDREGLIASITPTLTTNGIEVTGDIEILGGVFPASAFSTHQQRLRTVLDSLEIPFRVVKP